MPARAARPWSIAALWASTSACQVVSGLVDYGVSVDSGAGAGGSGGSGAGPELLADGLVRPTQIVLANDSIYWLDEQPKGTWIWRRALAGLDKEILMPPASPEIQDFAISADSVAWTAKEGDAVFAGPLMDGEPAKVSTQEPEAAEILHGGDAFYWLLRGSGVDGAIRRMGRDGGVETLYDHLTSPRLLAASGATDLVLATAGAALSVAPMDGSGIVTVYDPPTSPGYDALASDGLGVYWIGGGGVNRLLYSDPIPEPIARGLSYAVRIAVGSGEMDGVYWTEQGSKDCSPPGNGAVMRISKSGGTPQPLAQGLTCPLSIAVDTSFVYWTDAGDGQVWRVPK